MAREHSDTPRAVTVSLIYLIIIDSIPTIKNKSYTITHQNSLQLDQKYNFFTNEVDNRTRTICGL